MWCGEASARTWSDDMAMDMCVAECVCACVFIGVSVRVSVHISVIVCVCVCPCVSVWVCARADIRARVPEGISRQSPTHITCLDDEIH